MTKVVTDVVVQNAQKGQNVRVFYRENGKSDFIDTEIPRLFTSRRLHQKEVSRIVEELENDIKLKKRNVSIEVKNSGIKKVLWLRGPRDVKQFLSRDIFPNPGTSDQMLNYVDIPLYSDITLEDGRVIVVGESNPMKLLHEKLLCFDLETDQEGRRDGKYTRINTAAIKSNTLEDVLSIMGEQSKVIQDHRELAFRISESILNDDSSILGNHNLYYDVSKFSEVAKRTKTEEIFPIGVDETDPYTHAYLGFYKMPRINGRLLIDSMAFSQNWGWSKNNKLETVCEFFGIQYTKSLDYGQLEDLVERWGKEGDKDAASLIIKYAQQDVESTLKLLETIKSDIFDLAWLFEARIDEISWVSKSTLAHGLRDRRRFETLNDIRGSRRKELEYFDVNQAKINKLKENEFPLRAKRGYYSEGDVYVVYNSILAQALKPIIKQDKTFKYVYSLIANKERRESKIFLQQAIDAFCEEILLDLESESDFSKNNFDSIYKVTKNQVNFYLSETIETLETLFRQEDIELINFTPKFFFLRAKTPKKNIEKILDSCPMLELYGRADKVLSGTSANVIALMENGVLITPGTIDMDAKTRKGHRTPFERETMEKFGLFLMQEDYRTALEYLEKRCRDLAEGNIIKSDLLFTLTSRKDAMSYGEKYQDSERGEAIQQLRPEKDKTIYYGKTIAARMMANDFINSKTEVDITWYQNKFFGDLINGSRVLSKGTISDMAMSALPEQSSNYKLVLQKVLEGSATTNDITYLIKGNKIKNTTQMGLEEYV
ncbi:MAG: ribonuclease H-like domain-containing protein [Nanoarchaeota archaeon]